MRGCGDPAGAGSRPGTWSALGLVSLATDVSSEMVTAVLPAYLVLGLHLSFAQYGLLDGIYTGATALTRLYLVRGDFAAGTLVIMDDGVECPSLSPDDRRLVYKKRLPDSTWQLWVYDLGTGERTQLAEPGNVDDQGAWLDAETVAYGKIDENSGQVNVWSVPADGTGAPRLIAENAESPAGL